MHKFSSNNLPIIKMIFWNSPLRRGLSTFLPFYRQTPFYSYYIFFCYFSKKNQNFSMRATEPSTQRMTLRTTDRNLKKEKSLPETAFMRRKRGREIRLIYCLVFSKNISECSKPKQWLYDKGKGIYFYPIFIIKVYMPFPLSETRYF